MAKFLFNLEILLRHRENIEQKERDELFRLTYKYDVERANLDRLKFKHQETMKEFAEKQMEREAKEELDWYRLYLNRLDRDITESKSRLLQLQSEVQAQKDVVVEASKKRKVLSSLKARRQKEYVQETERQEQKEIDEWVATRFASKEEPGVGP